MTALLDLDANVALAHALALAEEAAAALADIPMDAVMGVGLGEEIVRLRSVTRRLDATTSALSERFASSHEWEADGARSAVRWLFGSGNDSWAGTHSLLGRGELMSDFPCMGGAWRAGVISAQHLDALGRVRRRYPALADDLVAVDEAIPPPPPRCEPREFYQRLRQLCHRVNPEAVDDRDRDQPTGLHVSMLLDGLVRIDGTLDAVLGARFMAMLESARRDVNTSTQDPASQGPVPPSPMSQRNLDALRRILDAAGAATGDLALPLVTGERPTINVTVPLEALIDEGSVEVAWLEQFGVPTTMITGAAARQLACDSSVRPLLVDRQGQLVAMMPKVRTIHPALRRAVFIRDRVCRFTGCRSRIDEVHHITYYRHGGPTVLSNLVGLCWHHHHLVHDVGWRIDGDPGGRLTFRSGRGRELTSDPPIF
ncbi:MAG: HNH endonuclease [Candidatus Nanopelagicales bacterium]|nr:HNH endonuclease [Candidatus Nanopelagicales bacterium]